VCIVNSYYPPWIGGAETYVSNLAKGLQEAGNQVTVYCASAPLPPGEHYDGGVRVRRERAPLRLYGTPLAVSPLNLFREEYDVVHCNFPSPYLSALFSWFGRMRSIPAVLTWHNDLPRVTSAAGLLVRAHDLLSPAYLEYFARIIATTEVYANTSPILKKYANKVRVIPNGVDTKRFSPTLDGRKIRDLHGFAGEILVLFVGALTRWHSYKGVDDLLRGFKLASDQDSRMRLLVVGSGSLLPSLVSLAAKLSIGDRVKFAGRVSDELLPLYYAASDFTVLPSKDRSEGFGLVLLEAMASGKPVIGSKVGGVLEVIEDGETGLLVSAGDANSLAGAMLELSRDSALRERMGKKGRVYAEGRDWSQMAALVQNLYLEVAKSKKTGQP
jgi:glycosyltransferase involved in cell wall biosynthesis